MSAIPFIPENAPFTADQRLWLNGYLAGFFSSAQNGATPAATSESAAPPPAERRPLTILFGSQTGTSEILARKAAKEADKRGFLSKVVCMEETDGLDLAKESRVLLITSTYGDGEPPDNAQAFWNFLKADGAPRLAQTRFSVLALGDTTYEGFCKFGRDCDARLEQLGAQRVHPRVDCDVDYAAAAQGWLEGALGALAVNGTNGSNGNHAAPAATEAATDEPPGVEPVWSRKNPFPARLLANRLLTAPSSAKEVRHFEISLADSGLEYEVGDALGVMPTNCPALVADILDALGCHGEETLPGPDGAETSLRLALLRHYDITRPSPDFLQAAGEHHPELLALLDSARRADLKQWLWGREIVDVLLAMSRRFALAEVLVFFKKLQPRLYSISSSPKAHPGEVHLTVGAVRYDSHGRARKGVASIFLADRADDSPVPVFVQKSHGFRLPADGSVPIIMCGPGTGIAPFRAFLEERAATGATGRNWLLFGDQRRSTDFLYEEQLEAWRADGHLARLDLAFSRDQAEKVYVQHRMLEHAGELWAWLEDGAHFYVCGDATRMAKDVDAALLEVTRTAGGLGPDAAAEYVQALKTAKRYQRDVY